MLFGPNLIWLNRSTVRIENQASSPVENIVVVSCDRPKSLGRLSAGESRFEVFQKCGDDTLEIRTGEHPTNCRFYVEGDMFHVQVRVISPTTADCSYSGVLPFWPLLIFELF